MQSPGFPKIVYCIDPTVMLPVTIAKCRQQLPVDLIPMWVNAAAPCASGVMLFVSHSGLKL